MEKEEILVCEECGAKISKKDLEYTENHHGAFPDDENMNTVHIDDCGCRYGDENYSDACHCKFVPVN